MAETERRLRVTQGLISPKNPPRVYRGPVELMRDGFLGAATPDFGDGANPLGPPPAIEGEGFRTVPHGLYLRQLYRLDLESDAAIAEFTSEYGGLWGVDWSLLVPPEWSDATRNMWRKPSPSENHRRAERSFPFLQEIRQRTEEWSWEQDYGFFHADEFRIRVRLLRDLTRTWLAIVNVRTEGFVLSSWESTLFGRPESLDDALWKWLVPALNVGLAPFHPRLAADDEPEDQGLFELYNVLCLQLASDIDLQRDFSNCEKCGEPYSRWHRASEGWDKRLQEGDSFDMLRKRAKGMKYCSEQCRSAATSKASRDKKRAQRNQGQSR